MKNVCRFLVFAVTALLLLFIALFLRRVEEQRAFSPVEIAEGPGAAVPGSLADPADSALEDAQSKPILLSPDQPESAASNAAAVPEKDVIRGERLIGFGSREDLDRFLADAKQSGIEVLGELSALNAVKVRAGGAKLEALLEGRAVRRSRNYYIRLPEDPFQAPNPSRPHPGFGLATLALLGVGNDNSTWGKGVKVAVLDSGVAAHPSLAGASIERMSLIEEAAAGDMSHGTAMVSLIAAGGGNINGVAPAADILAIQVMGGDGTGDLYTLASGIVEAVDRGAEVISISLGTAHDSFVLASAVEYALQNGAAVVASAGNDAVEGVNYPAKYEGVLGVGGVDAVGVPLYFSNRGDEVDLIAPGSHVASAGPEDRITGTSGTSAAAAIASGSLAWILSENPGMTSDEAIAVMLENTDDTGAPGRDDSAGEGSLNLGRIMNREQSGIYDAAACTPFVSRGDNGEVSVTLFLENRGTEEITKVEMEAEVAGQEYYLDFYNVPVGEVRSYEVLLGRSQAEEGVPVSLSAAVKGAVDAYPANNVVSGKVLAGSQQD